MQCYIYLFNKIITKKIVKARQRSTLQMMNCEVCLQR